jgi:hypothetical protein
MKDEPYEVALDLMGLNGVNELSREHRGNCWGDFDVF